MLLGRIAVWTVILSVAVKLRSLPAALYLLSYTPQENARLDVLRDRKTVTAVDAILGIDRFVFRPVCWKRAILLHRFLGKQGCASTVVFGVRKVGGNLKGHAWLEVDGSPAYEVKQPDYVVTYRFPSDEDCAVDLTQMTI